MSSHPRPPHLVPAQAHGNPPSPTRSLVCSPSIIRTMRGVASDGERRVVMARRGKQEEPADRPRPFAEFDSQSAGDCEMRRRRGERQSTGCGSRPTPDVRKQWWKMGRLECRGSDTSGTWVARCGRRTQETPVAWSAPVTTAGRGRRRAPGSPPDMDARARTRPCRPGGGAGARAAALRRCRRARFAPPETRSGRYGSAP